MKARPAKPYVVVQTSTSPERYDLVHLGPYVVAKDLKWIEAESLASALNEEMKDR